MGQGLPPARRKSTWALVRTGWNDASPSVVLRPLRAPGTLSEVLWGRHCFYSYIYYKWHFLSLWFNVNYITTEHSYCPFIINYISCPFSAGLTRALTVYKGWWVTLLRPEHQAGQWHQTLLINPVFFSHAPAGGRKTSPFHFEMPLIKQWVLFPLLNHYPCTPIFPTSHVTDGNYTQSTLLHPPAPWCSGGSTCLIFWAVNGTSCFYHGIQFLLEKELLIDSGYSILGSWQIFFFFFFENE